MTNTEITFHLEGPLAEKLAMELYTQIAGSLGAKPRVERAPADESNGRRARDPALVASVVSLVLSIPSTVLSTIQFVEWLRARRERERLASPIRLSIGGAGDDIAMDVREVKAFLEQLGQAAANNNGPAAEDVKSG